MQNVLREFFETALTKSQVMLLMRSRFGLSDEKFYKLWNETFTKEESKGRRSRNHAKSKIGENNPMFGKYTDAHHNWKGIFIDEWGYRMLWKPAWYLGNPTQDYVQEHILVYCKSHGMTSLPVGMVIHHIDGDKLNNALENLEMLTRKAHAELHWLERATTIERVPSSIQSRE